MKSILFHADIGPETGLGHWMRVAHYSKAFKKLNWKTSIVCFDDIPENIREKDSFENHFVCTEDGFIDFLSSRYEKTDSFVLLIDSYKISPDLSAKIKSEFALSKIFYIDDDLEKIDYPGDGIVHLGRSFESDLKTSPGKTHHFGLQYYPIGGDWLKLPIKQSFPDEVKVFSVVLGGGDCSPILEKIWPWLCRLKFQDCRLFVGPFTDLKMPPPASNWTFIKNANDFPKQILESDLVLCSGGVVSFELGANGMPLLILPIIENQVSSSSHFLEQEAAWILPAVEEVSEEVFFSAINQLSQKKLRMKLAKNATQMISKDGALNLAQRIDKVF